MYQHCRESKFDHALLVFYSVVCLFSCALDKPFPYKKNTEPLFNIF